MIDTASFIIIPCLDTNIGGLQYLNLWCYENGAIINNVLLEATALSLSANVIYDISNEAGLRSALGLSTQTNLLPLSVIPVGNPFTIPNTPPEKPDINGPTSGNAGTSYPYTFTSTDPDGDQVSYYIKWGDGGITDWTSFQASGPPGYSESHTWILQNNYTIEVKAKDIFGNESGWATYTITMPRNRAIQTSPFLNFLQNHPNLFPLLQRLLQRLGLQ
jgi:hypothetical protein